MRRLLFPLVLIVLFSIPAVLPFFQQGFFNTHDIIYLARIKAMSTALSDGVFPVRWISDFRYGEPLFNFYAPLPYYIGALIHFIGFDYITTAKLMFIIITIVSGISMYFLGKELWGKWGGLVSAFLFIYAPYRAVNLYLRGTLSEIFSFLWLPLIFYGSLKWIKTSDIRFLILTAFSIGFLVLTHNITAFIFIPLWFVFIIFLTIQHRRISIFLSSLLVLFLGFGISATFWLPAIWENNLVQTQKTLLSLDNFVNQFVKIEQFLKPSWGGFSISHELGIAHIALALITILLLPILWKKNKKCLPVIVALLGMLLFSVFMQTGVSLNFWLALPPLEFVQFPWRFMTLTVFFISLLGGSFFILIKSWRLALIVFIGLLILIVYTEKNYFYPRSTNPLANDQNFIRTEDDYLPKDYLPKSVREAPPVKIIMPVLAENYLPVTYWNIVKRSDFYSFDLLLNKDEDILVPIYYFPGWKGRDNNKFINLKTQTKTGLIQLSLPSGRHQILLDFTDTVSRKIGNFISITSLLLLSLWVIRRMKFFTGRAEKL